MYKIQKFLNKFFTNNNKKRFKIYDGLKKSQFFSRKKLISNQIVKLRKILNHCSLNVPYYIDAYKNDFELTTIKDLEKFPILEKSHIQDHFDKLTSTDVDLRNAYKNSTGGSTGEPLVILHDKHYHENSQANFLLIKDWRNTDPFDSTALIWGCEEDIYKGNKKSINLKIKDFLRNRISLNSFKMSEDDIKKFIILLNKKKPKLIIAYAQSIYEIAAYAKQMGLKVEPQKSIHTGAGTLHPIMKTTIGEVFQCDVYNHYGSREVGSIASECIHNNGLHILMDNNVVEIVDENGKHCVDGIEGDILVTTLNNYSMPLIRYRIGDRGIMSNDSECCCGCNYSKILKITGRTNGVFVNKKGDKIAGEFFTHIFLFHDWIKSFQIIQNKIDLIEIKIVERITPEQKSLKLKELENKVIKAMGGDCKIIFRTVPNIEKTTTGKLINTISNI